MPKEKTPSKKSGAKGGKKTTKPNKTDEPLERVEAWERQHKEGPEAFEAFAIYRDMGYARTLQKVSQQLKKHVTLIKGWSAKWDWGSRSASWDRETDRIWRNTQTDEIKKMAKRHQRQCQDVTDVLMAPVLAMARKLKNHPKVLDDMSAAALVTRAQLTSRYLPGVMKMERLSLGAETEITGTYDAGEDGVMDMLRKALEDGNISPIAALAEGPLDNGVESRGDGAG